MILQGIGIPGAHDVFHRLTGLFRGVGDTAHQRGFSVSRTSFYVPDVICDDAVRNTLTDIYVVPMHVYGNMERYDPGNNSFGFTKGDLRQVRINSKIALGAGEFVYQSTDFRTIYLNANENFWLGKSVTEQIILSKDASDAAEETAEG